MAILEGKLAGVFSGLSGEAAELADRVRAGVVVVRGDRGGQGSGVLWTEDGVVLTNDHVVGGDGAEVSLADGRSLRARLLRRDSGRDLAALRVEASGLPAVPVGESRQLRPGQLVLAVGNPLGVERAVAVGIVSGVPREVWVGGRRLPEMVQADVDLYPGNSGGPLVDAEGRVVGINSMVTGPGMALAVPSHVARQFLAAKADRPPRLGVALRGVALPRAVAQPLGLRSGRGVMVYGVVEGSPAERAGMLPGDLLVAMDEEKIAAADDVARHLASARPSRPIRVGVLRGGRLVELTVVT